MIEECVCSLFSVSSCRLRAFVDVSDYWFIFFFLVLRIGLEIEKKYPYMYLVTRCWTLKWKTIWISSMELTRKNSNYHLFKIMFTQLSCVNFLITIPAMQHMFNLICMKKFQGSLFVAPISISQAKLTASHIIALVWTDSGSFYEFSIPWEKTNHNLLCNELE